MNTTNQLRRFTQRTAVGALLAFDATVVFLIVAINVSFYTHDYRSLFGREPLLPWIPFALAALVTILLMLATGIGGAREARRAGHARQSTSLIVLALLNSVLPVLLAISHDSLAQTILGPIVGLGYLVLPALALLFLGRRTGLCLLIIAAFVAFGAALALLVLSFLFPAFGRDPSANYFIYFPPQFSVALMLLLGVMLFGLAAGVVCAIDGRLSRRLLWSDVFLIAVAAAVLGPILIVLQSHYPPLVSLSSSAQTLFGIVAGVAYIAMPILSLVYLSTSRRSMPHANLPGVGTVGTSL